MRITFHFLNWKLFFLLLLLFLFKVLKNGCVKKSSVLISSCHNNAAQPASLGLVAAIEEYIKEAKSLAIQGKGEENHQCSLLKLK